MSDTPHPEMLQEQLHAFAAECKRRVNPNLIFANDGPSPLTEQVGGTHYNSRKIQPVEYIHANGIPFCEGNVIKYVTRWRDKGGIADLRKAKHYIELLIDLESGGDPTP